jgi:hypothetical protein
MLAAVLLLSGIAAAATITETIDVMYRNIKLIIDGRELIPEDVNGNTVEPFIYNGSTYLPIRAVGQALDKRITWDGDTSTVYIGISNEPIVWRADIDHDGIDDRIVIEIYMRDHGADLGATLNVYKGDSDVIIYSAEVNVAHAGWDGFYLYYNDKKAYLMNWRPEMYQGDGNYTYEIFCYSDSGEKIIFDKGSYKFIHQDLSVEHKGLDEFVSYIQKVNSYLIQSHLLVDTDGGKLLFGTPDNPVANPYIPELLFDPQ